MPYFEVMDQDGNIFNSGQLLGRKTIIYFYPKDNTSGCTAQACNLRDNYERLVAEGYNVIGISKDSAKSHKNFASKYGRDNCYVQGDFLVHTQEREFNNAVSLIEHIFTKEHIGLIKVGKNLKKAIVNSYEFISIDDLASDEFYITFLDDFINPGQYIVR